ncbi:MAG: type II toxin-antitoxin system HicB family antitoxin [Dehalococcoidia bacterium]|nr:type II toxin-antitoxin system HicB family antitoxin [Dehalococcoidia bacterium]
MSAATSDRLIRLTIQLEQQPERGYTATAPQLPGLVTEGDTVAEAMANVEDALVALLELYEDTGKEIPNDLIVDEKDKRRISHQALIAV